MDLPYNFQRHRGYVESVDWRDRMRLPSSTPEAQHPGLTKNRKAMRKKMKGAWQEQPNFFDKFFRRQAADRNHANAMKAAWYNEKTQRWKHIPSKPQSNFSLRLPLRTLLNIILQGSGIPPSKRLFLRPNCLQMKVSCEPLPAPDLLLAGIGPAFVSNCLKWPVGEYSCGMTPVRVMLEADFRYADRHLSAVQVNEMFLAQDNRRFAYALILTESYLRAFMFDPSGAVVSPPMDYHARPEEFCAVITGIATLDEARAGFDTSYILDDSSVPRIWTTEPAAHGPPRAVSYRVKSQLFRASRFMGRATCCWLVEPDDEPNKKCVIKDAWIATSEMRGELEGGLIQHANQQGVVRGLVRIRHEARVQVPGRGEDTTVKNRRIRKDALTDELEPVQDRVHTRIVMDTFGKPLWKFSSQKELLEALHDAVQAHRNLYQIAGILHRDVSLGNILINPDGEEGDRGILIDLDHAVRLEHLANERRSVGTRKYMSYRLLRRKLVHSHLHDLESFYYVLCGLICEYNGPGDVRSSRVDVTPPLLEEWGSGDEDVAWNAKSKHLQREFELPVQPWFDGAVRGLARRLHGFFRSRTKSNGPKPHPERDYDEFLSHLRITIKILGPSAKTESPSPCQISPMTVQDPPDVSRPRKRKAEVASGVPYEPKPLDRPRRSRANYTARTSRRR